MYFKILSSRKSVVVICVATYKPKDYCFRHFTVKNIDDMNLTLTRCDLKGEVQPQD